CVIRLVLDARILAWIKNQRLTRILIIEERPSPNLCGMEWAKPTLKPCCKPNAKSAAGFYAF
ncbi:MAG: hypothetical protein LBB51_03835, partial [Zoogloeaceae bacterium]|nr:hypothetical protein [Zoogloeaceae bacterium]